MMRRILLGLLALLAAAPTQAQIAFPCGGVVSTPNTSSELGVNGWLQYTVSTSIAPNLCTTRMIVDAEVVGIPGSALHREAVFTATAQRQVPVPYTGPWVTNGKHEYQVVLAPGFRFSAGNTQSTAWVVVQQQADACSALGDDYYWDGGMCQYTPGSPLIVDRTGSGYRLTSVEEGVLFDLNGDGQVEQISWTNPKGGNAFLALDRNGNGRIDDGTELIGSYTPVGSSGDRLATTSNGFEALRFLEDINSTTLTDDVVNGRDYIFDRLLLWTDRNHNGDSEPDELETLAEAGVAAISLDYRETKRVDRFGNEFRQVARLKWADRRSDRVYDVWLQFRR